MIFLWILLLFLIPYLILTLLGPSNWDRLLGMSLISTKITLIAILFAVLNDLAFLIDFAFIYVLLGFISTFFITVYWVKQKTGGKI
jgi:multicomponent Na+:H+ antiporter subunit F